MGNSFNILLHVSHINFDQFVNCGQGEWVPQKYCIYAYSSAKNRSLTVFSGDVKTLTPLDREIISSLGLVREQGHRVGPVFLQTQGLWNDLAAPFNYHPNYNCITLQTCGRSQRMVNKYSHIPMNGSREWTGPQGTWMYPPLAPICLETTESNVG